MAASTTALTVVAYHYVRDLPRTAFPAIKGLLTDRFREQVSWLQERYEVATLESAMAFLAGDYHPARDLCLLTFDDGLKDHYTNVLPILVEEKLQGVFFVATSYLDGGLVASVHKSHFLMAAVDFQRYRDAFLDRVAALDPGLDLSVSDGDASTTYRFDRLDVARFKFLVNFTIPAALRDRVLSSLFADHFGDEAAFAADLYLNWDETEALSRAGMVVGGHSHAHQPLAVLDRPSARADLECCAQTLRRRLGDQPLRPFSYPYGGATSFTSDTIDLVRQSGFCCAFTTEAGSNPAGHDTFRLRRIDTNDVMPAAC